MVKIQRFKAVPDMRQNIGLGLLCKRRKIRFLLQLKRKKPLKRRCGTEAACRRPR